MVKSSTAYICILLLSIATLSSNAQAPAGVYADAANPSGPPDPNKLDLVWQVDNLTGALSVKIPFPTEPLGGRGPALPFSLSYNSSSTVTLQTTDAFYVGNFDPYFNGQAGSTTQTYSWAPGWAPSAASSPIAPVGPWTTSGPYFTSGASIIPTYTVQYPVGPQQTFYGCTILGPYIYVGVDGSSHDMNMEIFTDLGGGQGQSPAPQCTNETNPTPTGTTTDGSAMLTAQNNVVFPDGTTYNGGSFEDTNGNLGSLASDSETRTPLSTTLPVGVPGVTPAGSYTVTTTGASDQSETYDITVQNVPIGQYTMPHPVNTGGTNGSLTDFSCPANCTTNQPVSGALVSFITAITLPNKTAYAFTPDPLYGTISKITFPTGGYVRFVYGVRAYGIPYGVFVNLSNVVVTDVYLSAGFGAPEDHWNYCFPTLTPAPSPACTTPTVTAPDGTVVAYTGTTWLPRAVSDFFSGRVPAVLETQRLVHNSAGALIQSVSTAYDTNVGSLPAQVVTTNYDGPSPIQQQVHFVYDTYSNLIEKDESDFYACTGSPCAAAATPPSGWLRKTFTTYQYQNNAAWVTAHIVNKASQVLVTDGSGHPYSLAQYGYDNGAVGGALGYSNHDDTNYGLGSSLPRGNRTSESRCATLATTTTVTPSTAGSACSLWFTTTHIFDLAGQITSTTDPRGNSISYSYADNYAAGSGSSPKPTDGYVTTVTYPYGFTDTYSYEYATGQMHAHTDWNSQTTTYLYNDPDDMHRLTEIQYPDQGDVQFGYNSDPTPPKVTTTTKTGGSEGPMVRNVLYDGLGRVKQRQLAVSSAITDSTDTTYDNMERTYSVSNPYQSMSDPSYGITSYLYDALGRKTTQTAPYNSVRKWGYSGNTVMLTDEAGNQWQQTADGLGRLTVVKEPNGASTAPSLETDYAYDPNNNLTTVNQYGGAQGSPGAIMRTFNYDGLSRLRCASNPESVANPQTGVTTPCPLQPTNSYNAGTVGYSYDGNGNVTSRTDARGVATAYVYDALNRVMSKSYNDNGNTPSVSFAYDTGVLGINPGYYAGRLSQVKTLSGSAVVYNYSSAGYDQLGRPLGYVECPSVSDCTGAAVVWGAMYQYDRAGNPTQVTSQSTIAANGGTVGGVNQRNYSYDAAAQLSTVTADARLVGGQDAGAVTLFQSPTYNGAGQLTAASLAVSPSTQQSTIGLTRTYDQRLRPLSETDAGQVGTPGTQATATVNATGNEQSIGGSGTAAKATGTISLSYSGAMVKGLAEPSGAHPLYVGSSITLPNGYRAAFVASNNSAVAVANSIAAVLNAAASPVTAVVASGGTASAASVMLTTKATGAGQNGSIKLALVSQVKAAPASLTGGAGTTYDTGTVSVTISNTTLSTSYGQTSTVQTVAQGLASAIDSANLGVTASAGSNGALMVTANQPGTADNGMTVALSSSTSEPALFSSPSFSGTSGSLSGGANPMLSPGTIYSYSIPATPTPTTGYAGNGNLLSFSDLVNGGQWTATYDTLNRLSTATLAGPPATTLAWTYDAFGNRKSQTPGATVFSYPAPNNRAASFTYDASGNVMDDGSNQYGYDGEGRVCTVYNKTLPAYTGYAYDGLGNRVAKGTGMNSLSCDNNFTPTSNFVVGSNGEQLDELNASEALLSNVFANGQLLATYQFPSADWTYVLNDWLGTKRVVAYANGARDEYCTGFPFGDNLNCPGAGDPSPQHFTGKERDVESGNDYFGARYYSNNTGRWMSPDWAAKAEPVPYAKMENPQTLNLYAYVGNNPLSNVDADGHEVDLTNTDEKLRQQAMQRILSNVNKTERSLFTTVTDKDGKTTLILNKDAAASFDGKHSNGYNMLNQAINSKSVASVEINDHPTMPDGHSINTGSDAGGGRTVPTGNGRDVNIFLSSSGDQSGVNLYGVFNQVISNPVGIIAGHELLGHGRLFMLGRPSGENEAVGVENQLRKEQGLPLRGGGYN